jgi:hypothetical protein
MKVKVKFPDTEFGLFEPSFTVPVLGTAERFRGIYLDFKANGVPWSQLVLDEAIPRNRMLDETWDESPFFASTNDMVYWIIERILDSERECGEEIEIEYEGEDMEEKTITVPAGTDKVTLNIERKGARPEGMTLRQALMATPSDRTVIVVVRERVTLSKRPLCWEVPLPAAVGSCADETDKRAERVARFAECQLCDVPVLLDERDVKCVNIRRHNIDPDCIVFEVEQEAHV